MNKQEAIEIAKLLKALIELSAVDKILGTFIKAFKEKSILKDDGYYYLHSSINLGACVSGRMSSPLLMTIPSHSKYAKVIKKCFVAPKGYLMCSADFNSLESVVNALITKDPNKLRPLIEGIDSHCFNSFYYYPNKLKDIENTKDSLNSIKGKYADIRQDSKPISFALQYAGTWSTLVNNCGIPVFDAKQIEANYHKLYIVSDNWTEEKLNQASKDGYITVAFGLRVRTPILKQTILGTKNTPNEAKQEGRTVGNAMGGQSYSMLNNRAVIDLQQRILNSKYKYDIKPIATIHDALYFLVKNTVGCIEWFNNNLIECMRWDNLPELQHDIVKLGAELSIHYPNWSYEIGIPNNSNKQQILNICKEHK
jgi:DNA polymerase-1